MWGNPLFVALLYHKVLSLSRGFLHFFRLMSRLSGSPSVAHSYPVLQDYKWPLGSVSAPPLDTDIVPHIQEKVNW